ncbi:MAG TPA: nucleoside kinase [Candidatus Krumholzibacteria bacterium]|nr:nucleoside kinase [Candidatus Krumholzibacteria bacterium]HPD72413.1 nucleoside kinase [Candidatus Krumholzibacteria bacterium]HRY40655.1 nucleoside kinase [Candidatus Krumholzibacteria bacterium]
MAVSVTWVELDGKQVEVPAGQTLIELLRSRGAVDPQAPDPVVMASINGRRTDLYEPLFHQDQVRLYRLRERRTAPTIQRTVSFILDAACEQLFPGCELRMEFSYGRGVYCRLLGLKEGLNTAEIEAIEQRMRDLVAADLPITPHVFGLRTLISKARARGKPAETNLAQYLRRDSLKLYRLQGTDHLFYGRQLPSTGFVRAFRLVPEPPGFIMQVGPAGAPEKLLDSVRQPKLLHTMRTYADWLVSLELQDIGHLNRVIVQGKVQELVQLCEARHGRVFVDAANQVVALPEDGRLVLVAGPSSSGKTTFAKRLSIQLRVLGYAPFALSLDDYFVDREKTPKSPDGDYDYESLEAIRLDLFNQHLKALLAGEPVHLPAYDFHTGTSRLREEPTVLGRGQPLIVEGIHALNPRLSRSVARRHKLLAYVSALCHMNVDNTSYIRTSRTRLFRRIVRDAQFRGYTASATLARWPKVRAGEERHIFPFQNEADIFFNSGLAYELSVLKLWAEPRLAAVGIDDPNYGTARSLIDLLATLLPIDASVVPPTSLLREFIGGSSFNY